MKKFVHIISIIALILPSLPLYAIKEGVDGTTLVKLDSDGNALETASLLENGQPKKLTAEQIRQARIKAQRIRTCTRVCFVVLGSTCMVGAMLGSFAYLISTVDNNSYNPPAPAPTPAPNPCSDICWYLREFPGLPQGGYFIPHPCGCNRTTWEFVNCTTGTTTTFTTTPMPTTMGNETTTTSSTLPTTTMMMTNATNATTTAYYHGEVGFVGEHNNYTVCRHIPAPTPIPTNATMMLNTTTVQQLIEATGGTVDETDDIPELVEVERHVD